MTRYLCDNCEYYEIGSDRIIVRKCKNGVELNPYIWGCVNSRPKIQGGKKE